MANFKVVFRSDNQGADTSPGWEPGCPLLVNAVQVSRNTDTGQCYLQLKLSNISGATVNSFKLQADVSYVDGANETAELNPLDADIQPAKTYRPEPVLLTGSQIADVTLRVLSVSQPEKEWHTTPGSAPRPIPAGTLLVLGETAAAERAKSLEELFKNPSKYRRAIILNDNWWVCSCGMPNTCRDRCCRCDLGKDYLVALEDEQSLTARGKEHRARATKKKQLGIIAGLSTAVVVIAAFSFLYFATDLIIPNTAYNAAVQLMEEGDYNQAYSGFKQIKHPNAETAANDCALQAATNALSNEDYKSLQHWRSRVEPVSKIDDAIREKATQFTEENKLGAAAGLYQILGDEEAENQALYQYVQNSYNDDFNEFVVKFLEQLSQDHYEDSEDLLKNYIEKWKSDHPDIAS